MKKWSLLLGCLLVTIISFSAGFGISKASIEKTVNVEKTIAYDDGPGPLLKPTSISTTV